MKIRLDENGSTKKNSLLISEPNLVWENGSFDKKIHNSMEGATSLMYAAQQGKDAEVKAILASRVSF